MRPIDADELEKYFDEKRKKAESLMDIMDIDAVLAVIECRPTLDLKCDHAHWEEHQGYAKCSHCGALFTAEWEYCGCCGYKMDEEVEDLE